jgi:mono/diheme cytochrome c family protein
MKKLLVGALLGLVLGAIVVAAIGAAVIQSGGLDFAADVPHSAVTFRLIEWARESSIAHQADGIATPGDLASADRIRRGAGNYEAMCTGCHLEPGGADTEIRKGLYPTPPNLSVPDDEAPDEHEDAHRFWIIKHGIKGSGMPAWSRGGMEDEAIWDLVALLKALPGMNAQRYHELVESSEGHVHADSPETASDHAHESTPHVHNHADYDHQHPAH